MTENLLILAGALLIAALVLITILGAYIRHQGRIIQWLHEQLMLQQPNQEFKDKYKDTPCIH